MNEKQLKELDEMCSTICPCYDGCGMDCGKEDCDMESECRILYDAGYRKEEVIARETAQKIWEYCREKQYCNDEYIEWSVFLYDIQDICKQFGAEVGE